MIKYFEFETEIEKIETILNQLNNNKELNDIQYQKFKKLVSSPNTSISFSFGIVIKESTCFAKS